MRIDAETWLQAQYSVLGSVLISPEVAPRVMTETRPEDFSGPCLTVYQAMREIFRTGFPVDPVSVANKLTPEYHKFLTELIQVTPTAANVDSYIALCREQSSVLTCRQLAQQIGETTDVDTIRELLAKATGLVTSAQPRTVLDMAGALRNFMEKPAQKTRYLKWPLPDLNDLLYVSPGKFVILAAEPSVGKTAFALQAARTWAEHKRVGFFSFETDPDSLFERLVAGIAGISMRDIKRDTIPQRAWDYLCQIAGQVTKLKLDLISAAGMTPADIRAKILESGYQVVIVDYLQIVTAKGGSRYEQVTNISIDLHRIAQSLGVTILSLAQVSRADDDRAPRNSDLRESGQIEQDADVIMFLQLAKRSQPAGPRKLYVTKNKDGELFQMILNFDGLHQTFAKGGSLDVAVSQAAETKRKYKTPARPSAPAPVQGQMEMLPDDLPLPPGWG